MLPDGRSRYRNVPLSEKLIGEETWPDAVQRAVREELSGALPEGYQVCATQRAWVGTADVGGAHRNDVAAGVVCRHGDPVRSSRCLNPDSDNLACPNQVLRGGDQGVTPGSVPSILQPVGMRPRNFSDPLSAGGNLKGCARGAQSRPTVGSSRRAIGRDTRHSWSHVVTPWLAPWVGPVRHS